MASSNYEANMSASPPEGGARMRQVQSTESLSPPDTEENVLNQSEAVFLNYCYQSYRNDSVRTEVDNNPAAPELLNFGTQAVGQRPGAAIGRHLARLGDEFNERYADMFDGMISNLHLDSNDESAYDAFSCIARRVFSDGTTSWSRVFILLSFGYRIAITTLRKQKSRFADFLSRISSFLCRFLFKEKIAKWIADHGGWQAALSFVPGASAYSFLLVSGLATLSVIAVFAIHKYL